MSLNHRHAVTHLRAVKSQSSSAFVNNQAYLSPVQYPPIMYVCKALCNVNQVPPDLVFRHAAFMKLDQMSQVPTSVVLHYNVQTLLFRPRFKVPHYVLVAQFLHQSSLVQSFMAVLHWQAFQGNHLDDQGLGIRFSSDVIAGSICPFAQRGHDFKFLGPLHHLSTVCKETPWICSALKEASNWWGLGQQIYSDNKLYPYEYHVTYLRCHSPPTEIGMQALWRRMS